MPVTCDTSVLVPALLAWHPHHRASQGALRAGFDAVPAPVYAEAFSTLTRLPDARCPTAAQAREVLEALNRPLLTLSAAGYLSLISELGARGIPGGAVYDGIVGAAALEHNHTLLTADNRARRTYEAIGVRYELIEP